MAFTAHPGVMARVNKYDYREFIGYREGSTNPEMICTVGRYGFSNVFSASMFTYLNSNPEFGYSVAKAAVERFEQLLSKVGAMKDSKKLGWMDVATALRPRMHLVEAYLKAIHGLGGQVMKLKLDTAGNAGNPYKPTSQGNITEYVDYAILYWQKFPAEGPAYKLAREYAPKPRA